MSYFLRRLRHLGAPPGGPGRQLAVPRAGEDPAAEIAPLLPDLDAIDGEALAIVAAAEAKAARIEEDARRKAERILADAGDRALRERSEIISAEEANAEREALAILAAGRTEAQRVEKRAAAQAPRLVEEVISELMGQRC